MRLGRPGQHSLADADKPVHAALHEFMSPDGPRLSGEQYARHQANPRYRHVSAIAVRRNGAFKLKKFRSLHIEISRITQNYFVQYIYIIKDDMIIMTTKSSQL